MSTLLACHLLGGLSSFGVSFILGFTVSLSHLSKGWDIEEDKHLKSLKLPYWGN